MVYVVMACIVMAYIGMVYVVMTYVVKAYVVMAHIVVAVAKRLGLHVRAGSGGGGGGEGGELREGPSADLFLTAFWRTPTANAERLAQILW